jgi:hypothetical protein
LTQNVLDCLVGGIITINRYCGDIVVDWWLFGGAVYCLHCARDKVNCIGGVVV